jgi:hypothetical protein
MVAVCTGYTFAVYQIGPRGRQYRCWINVIARTLALQARAPGRAWRFEDLSAGCGGMPGCRCGDA